MNAADQRQQELMNSLTTVRTMSSNELALAPKTSPAFFSLLLRRSIIDPRSILKTYHKNCLYKTKNDIGEKVFNEVSTQHYNSMGTSTDEQTQVSQSTESKNTQTPLAHCFCSNKTIHSQQPVCSICSPMVAVHKRHMLVTQSDNQSTLTTTSPQHQFIDAHALIVRVDQGEQFLKFLYQQNEQLDSIYSIFLKNLQKYTDNFLFSLQHEYSLYGIYRRDIIWYTTALQEHINELQTKMHMLRAANKNFASFRKHFHTIAQSKHELETIVHKRDKFIKQDFAQKQSVKYAKMQQQFADVYQASYIQLRAVEQQRLLAIREQMRLAMNLTMVTTGIPDDQQLFGSTNFDDLLDIWDRQHTITPDDESRRPMHRYEPHSPSSLLAEIKRVINEFYDHRQITSINKHATLSRFSEQLQTINNTPDVFIKRTNSLTSNLTAHTRV